MRRKRERESILIGEERILGLAEADRSESHTRSGGARRQVTPGAAVRLDEAGAQRDPLKGAGDNRTRSHAAASAQQRADTLISASTPRGRLRPYLASAAVIAAITLVGTQLSDRQPAEDAPDPGPAPIATAPPKPSPPKSSSRTRGPRRAKPAKRDPRSEAEEAPTPAPAPVPVPTQSPAPVSSPAPATPSSGSAVSSQPATPASPAIVQREFGP
jgi:hypothetical protein